MSKHSVLIGIAGIAFIVAMSTAAGRWVSAAALPPPMPMSGSIASPPLTQSTLALPSATSDAAEIQVPGVILGMTLSALGGLLLLRPVHRPRVDL